jgi:phage-related protein
LPPDAIAACTRHHPDHRHINGRPGLTAGQGGVRPRASGDDIMSDKPQAPVLQINGATAGQPYALGSAVALDMPGNLAVYPVIVPLGDGTAAIWEHNTGIALQRLAPGGLPQGDVSVIALGMMPTATQLSDGTLVVVYEVADGSLNLHARHLDAAGAPIGAEAVLVAGGGDATFPAVTALPGNRYVVSWKVGDNIGTEIFAADGTPVAGSLAITPPLTGSALYSTVTTLGDGFAVTISYDQQYSLLQRFDASGHSVGIPELLRGYQTSNVTSAALADGGVIVTYSAAMEAFAPTEVYAQRFAASGEAVGGPILVNGGAPGNASIPAALGLPDGGFVIAWLARGGDAPNSYGVYAQRFNADGSTLGTAFLVNDTVAGNQLIYPTSGGTPVMALDHQGNLVVSWWTEDVWNSYARSFGLTAIGGAEDQGPLAFSLTAALADGADGSTLSVVLSGLPDGFVVSDGHGHSAQASGGTVDVTGWSFGSLAFTPPANYNGAFMLTATATAHAADGASATSTTQESVAVTAVNDLPVIGALPSLAGVEDTPFTLTAAQFAAMVAQASDIETAPADLIFTVTLYGQTLFSGHAADFPAAGVAGMLPADLAGALTGTFTVHDADGGSTSRDFAIMVANVNDAPRFVGIGTGAAILTKPQSLDNATMAHALSLDGNFALASDREVQDSASVPHVSVMATGGGHVDYYRFTVTTAGTAVFDIDHAQFDSILSLYDANGTLIGDNDDGDNFDPGSSDGTDSFLTAALGPGVYYIKIERFAFGDTPGLPLGATYRLNVSLQNVTVPAAPDLAPVAEDAGVPQAGAVVGTLVADLLHAAGDPTQSFVVDPDPGALTGIALTAADTAHGSWWFSLDGGASWQVVGAVDAAQALLLPADARLYFAGAADDNGSIVDAITFRLWDQTAGTAGTKASTLQNGGSTAFSDSTSSAGITVLPVNDAPRFDMPEHIHLPRIAGGFVIPGFLSHVTAVEPGQSIIGYAIDVLSGAWLFTDAPQIFVGPDGQVTLEVFIAEDVHGTARFAIRVTDDGGDANGGTPVATRILTLDIGDPNTAPVLAHPLADQSVAEDTPWSFTVPADAFFDRDGDALGYVATRLDGSALPDWLHFDAATRTFTGTPPQDFNGTIDLGVTANDATSAASGTFTLTVTPVNDAPALVHAIADQSVAEDSPWSFTVPADAFTDVEGDALSYTATLAEGGALPAWLHFDGATRSFSGTPPQDFNGTVALSVTASDGTLSASGTFTLTVTPVNDAPVLAHAIGDQSVAEDTPWSFTLPADAFADVDGDALSYTAELADGSALPTWLHFDATTRSFSGTPPQDFNGAVALKVTASDGTLTASDSFTLIVTPVNDAPLLVHAVADQSIAEDTLWTFTLPPDAFSDVDGDALSYAATRADGTALPAWLHFDAATRSFSGTPPQDFNGTVALKVTASDGSLTASDTFTLTVTPVDDAPVLAHAIADQSIAEDMPWSFTLPTDAFTDVDSDTLFYTATLADGGALPSWLHFDAAIRSFSGTPPQDFNGAVALKVTASDGTLTASDTFTLTVTPVNDTPAVAHAIADQNVAEDTPWSFTLPANAFIDVDDDALSYTATLADGSALPAWLHFDAATRTFSGTPPLNFNGAIGLSVTVSDGALSASDTLTLTVTPVNDAPVVGAPVKLGSIGMLAGARLITQADLLANVGDPDGPSLAAIALAIHEGSGTLTDHHDGTWSYTPSLSDGAHVVFGYQVSDGIAAPAADSASLEIAPWQASPPVPVEGTPGDDGFTAGLGNQEFHALGGVDTMTLNFRLVDAAISFVGNQVVIDTTSAHIVLTGFERYVFADGAVNNADDDRMVDDLYYYAANHDVWNAHLDADQHYHAIGWREGRDPSAFFSTATYLSLNPAVKAAGVDPLLWFDRGGWKTSDPSIGFDNAAYLAANPDVKAAGIDPLAHYLANGYQEDRQPVAPATLTAANGFDYVYYLQHNPDVAAAHVDPLQHYETVGWREGRNPNAFFDTAGYLAHYTDVAAAGINPLDHYDQIGWKEGRDPSPSFDTRAYLAHNPDVAAAHIDPLLHYLTHGLQEGRAVFADGLWG